MRDQPLCRQAITEILPVGMAPRYGTPVHRTVTRRVKEQEASLPILHPFPTPFLLLSLAVKCVCCCKMGLAAVKSAHCARNRGLLIRRLGVRIPPGTPDYQAPSLAKSMTCGLLCGARRADQRQRILLAVRFAEDDLNLSHLRQRHGSHRRCSVVLRSSEGLNGHRAKAFAPTRAPVDTDLRSMPRTDPHVPVRTGYRHPRPPALAHRLQNRRVEKIGIEQHHECEPPTALAGCGSSRRPTGSSCETADPPARSSLPNTSPTRPARTNPGTKIPRPKTDGPIRTDP